MLPTVILACLIAVGVPAVGRAAEPTVEAKSDERADYLALWRTHLDAGKAAHAAGDRSTAEKEFKAALAIASRENPPGLATAVSLNGLAVLYAEVKRWNDAAPLIDQAVKIFESLGQTGSEYYATLLTTRGDLARARGNNPLAERDYRQALLISGLPKPARDRALRALVGTVCAQGRLEEASRLGAELKLICRGGKGASADTP